MARQSLTKTLLRPFRVVAPHLLIPPPSCAVGEVFLDWIKDTSVVVVHFMMTQSSRVAVMNCLISVRSFVVVAHRTTLHSLDAVATCHLTVLDHLRVVEVPCLNHQRNCVVNPQFTPTLLEQCVVVPLSTLQAVDQSVVLVNSRLVLRVVELWDTMNLLNFVVPEPSSPITQMTMLVVGARASPLLLINVVNLRWFLWNNPVVVVLEGTILNRSCVVVGQSLKT